MLNPVATPNILISTSIKALETAISAKDPNDAGSRIFVNISDASAIGGDYIFSPKNTNFLSLEHTFGDKQFFGIKIKIQDPTTNLISLMHQQLNQVAALSGLDQADFFITYGLGPNVTSHWAGPFICQVLHFRNYTTANDVEIIEIDFVPSVPLAAQLSLQRLTDDNILEVTRTQSGMAAAQLLMQGTSPKVAGMIYSPMVTRELDTFTPAPGKDFTWTVPTQDLIDAIRDIYTSYATIFGISNFMIFLSQEFKDAFTRFLGAKVLISSPGMAAQIPNIPLSHVERFLAPFGLELSQVDLGSTLGNLHMAGPKGVRPNFRGPPPTPPLISTSIHTKLYITINKNLLNTGNFFMVFNAFYRGLAMWTNVPIVNRVLFENNSILIQSLQAYSPQAAIIKDPKALLVVVGEAGCLKEQLYGIDQKIALTPLPEEAWGAIGDNPLQSYYLNKINNATKKHYFQELFSGGRDFDYRAAVDPDDSKNTDILFEANTTDANILTYTFDTNVFTLGAIKVNFSELDATKEDIFKYAVTTLEQLVREKDTFDVDEVADILASYIATTIIKNKKLLAGTGKSWTSSDPKDWKGIVGRYIKYFYQVALTSGYTGTIKTIPYFQLSDNFMLGQVVRVKIQRTPTSDTYSLTDLPAETFYNGVYKIISFMHVINSTDAYSQFGVIKIDAPEKGLNTWKNKVQEAAARLAREALPDAYKAGVTHYQ